MSNNLPTGITINKRRNAAGELYIPEGKKYRMELQINGERHRDYFSDLGEAIAHREALLEEAELGSLMPKQSHRGGNFITVAVSVHKYLAWCEGKFNPATIRYRKRVLLRGTNDLPALAQEMGGTPIKHVDPHKVYEWLRDKIESETAVKRYNRFRREVVRFFNWAAGVDGKLIEMNPIDRNNVPRRKVAKKERPVPANGDMTKMKEAAIRLDEKAGTIELQDGGVVKVGQHYNFFVILAGAWARKGELLKLTFNDISWETNEIKLATRKGDGTLKIHWQPVDDMVMGCLRDQLENSVGGEYVFENRARQFRYTDRFGAQLHSSNNWIQKIAKEANLKVKGDANEWCSKNISAHSIRHNRASMAFENGENPIEIRDRMRHQNLATTNIYSKTLKPSTTITKLDF